MFQNLFLEIFWCRSTQIELKLTKNSIQLFSRFGKFLLLSAHYLCLNKYIIHRVVAYKRIHYREKLIRLNKSKYLHKFSISVRGIDTNFNILWNSVDNQIQQKNIAGCCIDFTHCRLIQKKFLSAFRRYVAQ